MSAKTYANGKRISRPDVTIEYRNEGIGSFRTEQNEASSAALDAILYDMVRNNA